VDCDNKLGFRDRNDVESPIGKRAHYEVICAEDKIANLRNGVVVNHCFDIGPPAGKILIQPELSETFVRRWEL